MFQSLCTKIITIIQNSLGKCSGRIIDLVIEHNISISKYSPSAGSNYVKLTKELNHPKKSWLIFKILMIPNALNEVQSDTYRSSPSRS